MKEYIFPKSIDELKCSELNKCEKGSLLEDFLYHYLMREFDNVLYTSHYDMGVDLVVYNEGNPNYRIGIQAKNYKSREIYKKDIQSMNVETEKLYHLSEMRLFTTANLNNYTIQYCRNMGIEYYEEDDIKAMIEEVNSNTSDSDILDLKTDLYKLRNNLMVEYGKSKPHHIMSYRTIKDLLEKKPRTINELYEVYGFGDYKVKNYGSRIINLFNQ